MLVLYLIVFNNFNVGYAAMYVGIAELWFVQHVQLCVTNAKLNVLHNSLRTLHI